MFNWKRINNKKSIWRKAFRSYSLRLFIGFILGVISLLVFLELSEDLLFDELQQFDQIVTGLIRIKMSTFLTKTMIYISALGSSAMLTILGLLFFGYVLFVKKHFWDSLNIPIVLIGATILNNILKIFFHRQRPMLEHLVPVAGLSFPSGHAMISYAFYGLVIYLVWINTENKYLKSAVAVLLSLLILLIGISRIYLGVHYPSDVLAGFAAGSFWLIACILGLKSVRLMGSDA
ncbi:MAG: phosphatase PAP2 family protein [Clostridia bacterium]|nr:phosphatase PAP2 family protein [Clostridia bacterium]